MKGPNRAGFSLVELLAGIAIIAILVAILIMTTTKVRLYADATTCTSNLRQIHGGIMAYAQDHDGQFPDLMVRNEQGTAWVQWWKVIAGYLEAPNPNLFPLPCMQCPATTEIAIERLSVSIADILPNYGMNDQLGRYQYNPNNPVIPGQTVTLSTVIDPANTLLVGDVGVGATSTCAFMNKSSVAFQGDKHPGGSNLLWVDGHVSRWEGVERLGQAPYHIGGEKDVWSP